VELKRKESRTRNNNLPFLNGAITCFRKGRRQSIRSLDELERPFDPTLKIQRRALKGINDFSPSRTYNPEDLLELVNSDANARDI
jgi:hypothetical protein